MLGEAVEGALPMLRQEAESLMVDTCTITRQRLDADGEPVREMDPVTLELVDVFDDVHEGRCRVQRGGRDGRESVSGGVEFGVTQLDVQLPLGAVGIKRGDRVAVTAIAPITDPDLLGVVATVKTNATKTHPTKRTLVCEEVD